MKKYDLEISVDYIPLPPEKQAAYEYSMRTLGEMLRDLCIRARQDREQAEGDATQGNNEDHPL